MKRIFHLGLFITLLCSSTTIYAADLIRILPVTDRILMLHFDEGHLDYQGIGEDRYQGITVYYSAMNVAAANQTASYQISSPNDPSYQTPQLPLTVGRKAKGEDFNNIYDPGEPTHLKANYFYLELPTAMTPGQTYSVQVGDLADNLDRYTFTFDPHQLRSETIHLNQLGFSPQAKKYAYLSHWMGDFASGSHQNGLELDDYANTQFHLIDQTNGQVVFSGPITFRKAKTSSESTREVEYGPNKNYSRADVWECDFSAFTNPGTYVLSVDRMGCSYPFEIRADILRDAYAIASHGLFVLRAGIEKEVEPDWVFPRDLHPDGGTQTFYYDSSVVESSFENQDSFSLNQPVTGIWGWYHDAGDWDHYGHHVRVPAILLHLYNMKAESFQDGDVNNRFKNDPTSNWIDEGQNGLPDLLDEGGWLVHFLRRARHALMTQGLGTGGVPGYVGRDAGAGEQPSWTDTRDLYVTGENPTNTYDYAGIAALYARCLQRWQGLGGNVAQDSINAWIAEAEAAFVWAQQAGGDTVSLRYASAALYLATGDSMYQSIYQSVYLQQDLPSWFGANMTELANLLYAVIPSDHPHLDTAQQNIVRQHLTQQLRTQVVDYSEQVRGYRWSSPQPFQMNILGTFSTPRTTWLATAHYFTGDSAYLRSVRAAADYFLGGNEMNMVWMTGFGDHFEQSTFHPNSWCSRDYNSMVYRNPIASGLVPYGVFRNCDWRNGCNYTYVGDEDFSRSTAYPDIDQWPQAEARFQNRESIAGSEFTIHQTQVEAIFTLGYLCEAPATPFVPNQRPTLSLGLNPNQQVELKQPLTLTVTASADMQRVAYFYDFHYIGESSDSANQFAYEWTPEVSGLQKGDEHLITAVGYDDKGLPTLPTPEGDQSIEIICTGCATDIQPSQKARISIMPTPQVDSMIRLEVYGLAGQKAQVKLISLEGKEVYRKKVFLKDAFETVTFSKKLPTGIYVVQLETASHSLSTQLILR